MVDIVFAPHRLSLHFAMSKVILFLSLGLILLVSSLVVVSRLLVYRRCYPCPFGWQKVGKQCIRPYNVYVDWQTASDSCQALGASLPSDLESSSIYSTLIGGHSPVWTSICYLNGGAEKRAGCLGIMPNLTTKSMQRACYVCVKPVYSRSMGNFFNRPCKKLCPPDTFRVNDRCYHLSKEALDLEVAVRTCHKMGMELTGSLADHLHPNVTVIGDMWQDQCLTSSGTLTGHTDLRLTSTLIDKCMVSEEYGEIVVYKMEPPDSYYRYVCVTPMLCV